MKEIKEEEKKRRRKKEEEERRNWCESKSGRVSESVT